MYERSNEHPAESVARMVNVGEPPVVGVPDNTPVAAFSVKPAGNAPVETANVYGPVPPPPVSVCVYAVPTTPFASVAGVSVIVGHAGGVVEAQPPIALPPLPAIVTAPVVPVPANARPATFEPAPMVMLASAMTQCP